MFSAEIHLNRSMYTDVTCHQFCCRLRSKWWLSDIAHNRQQNRIICFNYEGLCQDLQTVDQIEYTERLH